MPYSLTLVPHILSLYTTSATHPRPVDITSSSYFHRDSTQASKTDVEAGQNWIQGGVNQFSKDRA